MSEEEDEEEESAVKLNQSSGTKVDKNMPLNDLDDFKDQFQNASENNEIL